MSMNNRVCRTFTLTNADQFYEVYTDLLRAINTEWGSASGIIIQAASTNSDTVFLHDGSKVIASPGCELFATFMYSEQSTLNNIPLSGLYLRSPSASQKVQISARRS